MSVCHARAAFTAVRRRARRRREQVMTQQHRIALREPVGTLTLVVGGPGTAILATGVFFPSGSVGVLGVAIAFGLSLLCAAYAIGSVSGFHLNPVATLRPRDANKTTRAA